MSGFPGWLWSASLGCYYYIDPRTGEHVLQNGRRFRHPTATRPRFVPQQSMQAPSRQLQLSGSPPGPNANYQPTAEAKGKGREYDAGVPSSAFQSLSLGGYDASSAATAPGSVPQRPGTLSRLVETEAGDVIVETIQPQTKVVSRTQSTPAEKITDPKLLRPGFQAHKKLLETPNDTELDPGQFSR